MRIFSAHGYICDFNFGCNLPKPLHVILERGLRTEPASGCDFLCAYESSKFLSQLGSQLVVLDYHLLEIVVVCLDSL